MPRTSLGIALSLAALTAGALVLSCKSTKIAEVWVPKGESPQVYRRLMIVGLAPNPGGRAQYENDFVDRLANVHVLAVASVNLIPDVKDIDRKTIESWLAEYHLDGVALETDLFDARTEKLVYSAVTKTFNPSSREKTVHAVIDALFTDMVKRGLLPAKAP